MGWTTNGSIPGNTRMCEQRATTATPSSAAHVRARLRILLRRAPAEHHPMIEVETTHAGLFILLSSSIYLPPSVSAVHVSLFLRLPTTFLEALLYE